MSKSNKFTTGPWVIASYDEQETELAVTIDGFTICLLDQSYFQEPLPREQTEANARLIAAAPELLEALKMLMSACPDSQSDPLKSALENAALIVAKATGGAE